MQTNLTVLLATSELGSTGPDLTRYLFVVATLVAALCGLGWGLRRFLAGSIRVRASRRSLAVVDVLPLGGRRQLTVVRCYDRTFALGIGEKDVSLVAELDSEIVGPGPRPTGGREETRRFERLFDLAKTKLAERTRERAAAAKGGTEATAPRLEEIIG